MTGNMTRIISIDREDMSETERELFLKDLKKVTDEYFECEGDTSLEVTRGEEGFLICVLMSVRRIKSVKTPQ